ncbi:hypothetical protein BD410DRAFT_721048, partial [Rickenella mellea]
LQYICLASITILYYDHLLTLPSEVKYIRRQRLSSVSVIFLLNRYLTFLSYVPIMFFFFNFPLDDKPFVHRLPSGSTWNDPIHFSRCTHFSQFPGALYCITILIIRVYALYYREIWVLVPTGMLGASTVATSIVR